MARKGKLYALWSRVLMRNPRREPVGYTWVARTTRDPVTSLEMCQALGEDLTRCGVSWKIVNHLGEVVEVHGPQHMEYLSLERRTECQESTRSSERS